MKKSTILVLGLFALLAAFTFVSVQPAPANAQQVVLEGLTIYNVNIRTAPGTNRPIIDVLPSGATFNVIGRNEENTWVQVEYQDTIGWSAAWLLVYDQDTVVLPVTTDVEAPPASDVGPFPAVLPFNMNVRGTPSTFGTIIDEIPYLTNSEAVARNESNSWLLIEYGNGQFQGWVALWKVVILGDVGLLPISTAEFGSRFVIPPTATPSPTSTGTTTPATPATSTPEPTVTGTPPTAAPTVVPTTDGIFTHSVTQGGAPVCHQYTATNALGFPVDEDGQPLIAYDEFKGSERGFVRAYTVNDSAFPSYINIDGSGEAFASNCNEAGNRCTTVTITLCASAAGGSTLTEKRFDLNVTLAVGYQSFADFISEQTFTIPVSVTVLAP